MYCILVTGIPASGKSTLARALGEELRLPVISKDSLKEILFDQVGFRSREEKVRLGNASMEIMYAIAGQFMGAGQPFLLENNFERASEDGIKALLARYRYPVLTLHLTGDYSVLYRRFLERESSPDRHRGHVVNDCYPEKAGGLPAEPLQQLLVRVGGGHRIRVHPQHLRPGEQVPQFLLHPLGAGAHKIEQSAAGGTRRGQGLGVAAVVAHQPPVGGMVGQMD